MSLHRNIRQFFALNRAQRRTVAIVIAHLPLFWTGLRVVGFARFQALLRRVPSTWYRKLVIADPAQLALFVNAVTARALGSAHCLTRSLLLDWLLRGQGVKSELRLGVQISHGVFFAHAWVEVDGVPLNDRADIAAQFPPFGDLVPLETFQV